MRKFASGLVALAILLGVREASHADTGMKVDWLTSLEAAKEQAAATGRPILYFQLLGRLDEEYC
ncbi:MAG: hypothetical protein AAB434_11805 [Planctomycetota bacterium]